MNGSTELGAIVVGYDASPASSRALAFALRLAGPLGARLFLVHAHERELQQAQPITEEESTSVEEAVATGVASWAERAAQEGVPLVAVARERPASTAILSVAEEVHADLIVVGTRGLRPLVRTVLGSVSADVLARSRTPVVVVP
jgi:nucleotide-binding universal stress UspA family protein